MRGIWNLAKSSTSSGTVRTRLAAAVAACTLAAACSQTPTNPTASPSATVSDSGTQASRPGWEHFDEHGWNCRQPPTAPGVTVCSPPGQPLPVVAIPPAQPPADRPPTVTLKRWINGVFDANVLLIRPEIYNGQPCESTGAAYTFVAVLGYFECAHPGEK